jgi:hypothetical protein
MAAISFWTYQLNGSTLLIDQSFNLKNISIELVSGSGGFSGETTSGGIASALLPLYLNKPVTLSSGGYNNISGIFIDGLSGVINIVAF